MYIFSLKQTLAHHHARGFWVVVQMLQGPGDHLSHAQTAWIHELMEAGAVVELCHVSEKL